MTMHPDLIPELVRMVEEDIAAFDGRMQKVPPTYQQNKCLAPGVAGEARTVVAAQSSQAVRCSRVGLAAWRLRSSSAATVAGGTLAWGRFPLHRRRCAEKGFA